MQIVVNGPTQEKPESQSEHPRQAGPDRKSSQSFSHLLEKEQTRIEDKVKPEKKDPRGKRTSETDDRRAIAEKLHKKIGRPEGELGGIFRLLYDLVYRDRAEWTIADKEHFGVEKGDVSLREFSSMLSARGLKLQDFSFQHLEQMTRLHTRRQLTAFLDKLLLEMEAGSGQGHRSETETSLVRPKSSLGDVEREFGVKEEEIVREIMKQISIRKIKAGTEVNILLNPRELGEVNLALILNEKGVTARFKTNRESVKEILEKHLDELAKAFSKQGLRIEELQVQKIS